MYSSQQTIEKSSNTTKNNDKIDRKTSNSNINLPDVNTSTISKASKMGTRK